MGEVRLASRARVTKHLSTIAAMMPSVEQVERLRTAFTSQSDFIRHPEVVPLLVNLPLPAYTLSEIRI